MSPISIAGSGTITGISAGGLPDDCITTAEIAANAVTYAKIGTTEQGQLCKAWVNFDGTSTVAIRASYNVSSITDNGTGVYTANFATAMPDANYSVAANGDQILSASDLDSTGKTVTAKTRTTSSIKVCCGWFGNQRDFDQVFIAIFR